MSDDSQCMDIFRAITQRGYAITAQIAGDVLAGYCYTLQATKEVYGVALQVRTPRMQRLSRPLPTYPEDMTQAYHEALVVLQRKIEAFERHVLPLRHPDEEDQDGKTWVVRSRDGGG